MFQGGRGKNSYRWGEGKFSFVNSWPRSLLGVFQGFLYGFYRS